MTTTATSHEQGALLKSMAKLTENQKSDILAQYAAGSSLGEIARAVKRAESTVRSYINREVKNDSAVAGKNARAREAQEKNAVEKLNARDKSIWVAIDHGIAELLKSESWRGVPPQQITTAIGTLVDKVSGTAIHLEKLKAEVERLHLDTERIRAEMPSADDSAGAHYHGIPAQLIAPVFAALHHDITRAGHREYVLPGGRLSTKSTFISLEVLNLLMTYGDIHALCVRRRTNTLEKSVYAQILWAIDALGLDGDFRATTHPLEITRISTGQKILFRGADDPGKLKSIKLRQGYIGVTWFEELDQFDGAEDIRKIEQSSVRGGEIAYIFKSFNPPRSKMSWANKYLLIPKPKQLITRSTYTDVPPEWLGQTAIEEAEFLKSVNPKAYENEYLGVANGSGGNVFENVVLREITYDEMKNFDRIYSGVDWGYYPDPYCFERMYFDAARRRLFIYGEYWSNKQSNEKTSRALLHLADGLDDVLQRDGTLSKADREALIAVMGVTYDDLITADSAEPKSIGDYKSYGHLIRGAEKGPGSVDYSMKWLSSLAEIVIDPVRCPKAAEEFEGYEYERNREGDVISGYPDRENHAIDAVRYALNPVWRRKGE